MWLRHSLLLPKSRQQAIFFEICDKKSTPIFHLGRQNNDFSSRKANDMTDNRVHIKFIVIPDSNKTKKKIAKLSLKMIWNALQLFTYVVITMDFPSV